MVSGVGVASGGTPSDRESDSGSSQGGQRTQPSSSATHTLVLGPTPTAATHSAALLRIEELERQVAAAALQAAQSARASTASVVTAPRGSSAVELQFRMAAVQPPELAYANASKAGQLDDWVFKLEQLFWQTNESGRDWRARVGVARLYWDRQMDLWWKSFEEATAGTEDECTSWQDFVGALHNQFAPSGDAEAARIEVFRLSMRGGESMDGYLQRANLIVARAGEYVSSSMAGAALLEGVDKARFQFTLRAVRTKQREAGAKGLTFAQMRVQLAAQALDEPGRQQPTPSQSPGAGGAGGQPQSGSGQRTRPQSYPRQVRINALRQELQDLEADAGDGDEQLHVAPIGASDRDGGGLRCHKCGEPGHVVVECQSKKELRKCYRCGKVGHVRTVCREKPKEKKSAGGGAGPAAAGMPKPKNE